MLQPAAMHGLTYATPVRLVTLLVLLEARRNFHGDMIVFATKNRLSCCEGSLTAFATSHYLEKYKLNRESIHKKNAWKTEGMGAAFQGLHTSPGGSRVRI